MAAPGIGTGSSLRLVRHDPFRRTASQPGWIDWFIRAGRTRQNGPVLMPLAPAATLLRRFGGQLELVLAAHGVPAGFIAAELSETSEMLLGKTVSRSVVGIMNEFTHLAGVHRQDEPDLLTLAVHLAATPCSPLYQRHVSPDRELAALVAGRAL